MSSRRKINVLILFALILSIIGGMTMSANSLWVNAREASESNHVFTITPGFTLVAENDDIALYLNEASLAIRIVNKSTGFVWSSDVEYFGEEHINNRWMSFIQSGVTIEYLTVNNGLMDRRTTEESFLLSGNSTARIERINNGFNANVVFGNSGIEMTFSVIIAGSAIEIVLNSEDIIENDDNKLVSVQLFPFLGATRYAEQEGYFVIPDGVGALVSFERSYQNVSTPYSNRYFGEDFAISLNEYWDETARTLTFPIYGVVHGIRDNAFYTEIVSGAPYAELIMYPAGVRTSFFSISNRFLYRQLFNHLISEDNVAVMFTPNRAEFDIIERIHFLVNDQADYVGIATHYRNNLVEAGLLSNNHPETPTIPLSLEVVGASTSEGIFFNRDEIMTTFDQTRQIISDLNNQLVYPVYIHFDGAFRSGTTGRERGRYRLKRGLGSERELRTLLDEVAQTNNRLALERNYTSIFSSFAGISMRQDLVRRVNNQYVINQERFGATSYRSHLLNMNGFAKAFAADINHFERLNIQDLGIVLPSVSSSHNNTLLTRTEAFVQRASILENNIPENFTTSVAWDGTLTANLFPMVDSIRNVELSTSLYPYVTDQIPLISLILRGYIDLFSDNLNLVGNPTETVLRLIEWGIYPQFQITYEASSNLMYSKRPNIVSSRYDDWRDRIVNIYQEINEALAPVRGMQIVAHEVLEQGVVVVTYSNGVRIYINYNNTMVRLNHGIIIEAQGFEVVR